MKAKNDNTTIKLTNGYFVEVGDYNYTLKHKETVKNGKNKGELYLVTVGCYPDLKHVLSYMKKKLISDSCDEYTIDSYIEKLSKLEDWCTTVKAKM